MAVHPPEPEESVFTIQIDAYYENSGMLEGWSEARVNRLARALRCTAFELGKLCAVDIEPMKKCLARGKFPPPICLHFALLEERVLTRALGKPSRFIMPTFLVEQS